MTSLRRVLFIAPIIVAAMGLLPAGSSAAAASRSRESASGTCGFKPITVAADGGQPNGDAYIDSLSRDGRYVLFDSSATNLVAGDTNKTVDVFRRDVASGATLRVSVAANSANPNGGSGGDDMSADGRYVVFESLATNYGASTNKLWQVYERDLNNGRTVLVSRTPAGTTAGGNGSSYTAAVSTDGRYVAFTSQATNLVNAKAKPSNSGDEQVFLRDIVKNVTTQVSVAPNGQPAAGDSWDPVMSANGRLIVFDSDSPSLSPHGDGQAEIYVRDVVTKTTTRITTASNGAIANGASAVKSVTPDGRFVLFDSSASNLAAGDTNDSLDGFVRDLKSKTTRRVTVLADGSQIAQGASVVSLSEDASMVTFRTPFQHQTLQGGVGALWVSDRTHGVIRPASICDPAVPFSGGALGISAVNGAGNSIFVSTAATNVLGTQAGNGTRQIFTRAWDWRTISVSVVNGAVSGITNKPATIGVRLRDGVWGTPMTGKPVTYSMTANDGSTALAGSTPTNNDGDALSQIVLYAPPGAYTLTFAFAGDSTAMATARSIEFVIAPPPPSRLVLFAPSTANRGSTITLRADLTDPRTSGAIPDETITFASGSLTATATTGPDGAASVEMPVTQDYGPQQITAEFVSDGWHAGSKAAGAFEVTWQYTFTDHLGAGTITLNVLTDEYAYTGAQAGDVTGVEHASSMPETTVPSGDHVATLNEQDVKGTFDLTNGHFGATATTPAGTHALGN